MGKNNKRRVNTVMKRKRTAADVEAESVAHFGDPAVAEVLATALQRRGQFDRTTQGFHSYPARLHPLAAADLIGHFRPTTVLDPFCGGGTLLVEAMMVGAQTWGRDLNPVAVEVARARTRLVNSKLRSSLLKRVRFVADEAQKKGLRTHSPRVPTPVWKLRDWYQRSVFDELGNLLEAIGDSPEDTRPMLYALHSSLVIKFSQRASDTSNRRVPIRRTKGAVIKAFVHKAD